MKPILHGMERLDNKVIEQIPAEQVNITGLINLLEANKDKEIPLDLRIRFETVSKIYNKIFIEGEMPEGWLQEMGYEIAEIAMDDINGDLEDKMFTPEHHHQFDYYYEYGRGLGMDAQGSLLPEHLDEESDFI